jgi:hypothetical protein
MGGAWLGPAGCYCERCRDAFKTETGYAIPLRLDLEGEAGRAYAQWRAGQVARTLADLRDYAHALRPGLIVSANDFDAVMRPSTLVYGIDLARLARAQDVVMIEDYGLPRWEPGARPALVNNALTLRTARALVGETPLTTDPYDKGIGFDGVYTPRRFVQGMAEAAACGAPMVVKGTEFVEAGEFTLLTAERFAPQRRAIGDMHRWLEAHAELYQGRRNAAPIGLLHPGVDLWLDWNQLAPTFFGAGQALLRAGLPWRVVNEPRDLNGLSALLTFGTLQSGMKISEGVRRIHVPDLPGWAAPGAGWLRQHRWLRPALEKLVTELVRAYFSSRLARQALDALGLSHSFVDSPLFRLPPEPACRALRAALGTLPGPRARAEAPVLVEVWNRGDERQVHLVNYAGGPQSVTVDFGRRAHGRLLSLDGTETRFEGESVTFALDVYTMAVMAGD